MSKKSKILIAIILSFFAVTIAYMFFVRVPQIKSENKRIYDAGITQIESGDYKAGIETLYSLIDWQDTREYIEFAWEHLENRVD